MKKNKPINVLGERLKPCSNTPLTGFYRDGCCNTGTEDCPYGCLKTPYGRCGNPHGYMTTPVEN